jgi:hypothetical protein
MDSAGPCAPRTVLRIGGPREDLTTAMSKGPRRLLTPCPALDSDRGAFRAVAEVRPWRSDVVDRMTHKWE